MGAGRGGTEEGVEVVVEEGAGREGEGLVEGAGNGGKRARGAGKGGRATAAGRGETTTHWSLRPAPTPTATWSSWLWRTGWVRRASRNEKYLT